MPVSVSRGLMLSSDDKAVRPGDLLVRPLPGVPRVAKGADVARLALAALDRAGLRPQDGDMC